MAEISFPVAAVYDRRTNSSSIHRALRPTSQLSKFMAFSIIIVLYVSVGFLAAAGSVCISKKLFSAKAEQRFFSLFLIAIAGFYLAFTAYFGREGAWQLEAEGVIVFVVFGLLGVRMPLALVIGYLLHGVWDVLHEIHAHGGGDVFGGRPATDLPLAYFYMRRGQWRAAWARH